MNIKEFNYESITMIDEDLSLIGFSEKVYLMKKS
jgi:hypothetical protein